MGEILKKRETLGSLPLRTGRAGYAPVVTTVGLDMGKISSVAPYTLVVGGYKPIIHI